MNKKEKIIKVKKRIDEWDTYGSLEDTQSLAEEIVYIISKYTKRKFDVEELEEWLKGKIKEWEKIEREADDLLSNEATLIISTYQEALNKAKEILK